MTDQGFILVLYISFFLCTGVFSFLINGLFLKFSKTLGIRNVDDTIIRWGSQSKPAFGGISFYIIFLFSGVTYSLFFEQHDKLLNINFLGQLAASTLGFLIGLADDAYNTKPLLKFLAQLSCGIILVITGTVINIFPSHLLNITLTILWVVAMMNSINMLDNMDGITTIVSIGILLCALLFLTLNKDFTSAHYLLIIGGLSALIGFLFFNWNPSKMYMGDTGSQFLGIFLSAISIEFFWNGGYETSINTSYHIIVQCLIVAVVFVLPIADTTTVVINRISKGQSPFVGGKDHTTHHLSYLGFSDKKVALVFGAIGLVNLLICYFVFKTNEGLVPCFVLLTYFLLVTVSLFYITRIKKIKTQ